MSDNKELAPLPDKPQAREPVRQRVPKKIRDAIDAIAFGKVRSKKAAAEKAGISREYFSRSFQKPAIAQYAKEASARAVAMGAMRAAAVLNELVDCSSSRVRLEAAKTSLQAAGIVGAGQNVNVNVGVEMRAGYVIDLSGRKPGEPESGKMTVIPGVGAVIVPSDDAAPKSIAGIGPGGRAGE